jgi:hypothetical protein
MTKDKFKQEAHPQLVHLYHHLQMYNSTGGDGRVLEGDLSEPSNEVRRGKDHFFSFRIATQKSNIPVIPCTVVADR